MLKRITAVLLLLALLVPAAQATILPAAGTDVNAPAVVLCQSLTVLDARGDQGGQAVDALYYTGSTVSVLDAWDGWAQIAYADGSKTGWVRSEYLMMDPAWYLCDESTQVYAYPYFMAPRVALLETGTTLPILTETEADGSEWVCVSLRGASGWIRKTPADTADRTWFRPDMLEHLTLAGLAFDDDDSYYYYTGSASLTAVSELLTHAEDMGGMLAGCPFGAAMHLETADGREIELRLATDSCCVYRVDGRDYQYARHLKTPDSGVDNSVLFSLFGLTPAGTPLQ